MTEKCDLHDAIESKQVIPVTAQENFINDLYYSIDDAAACELNRLRSEEQITPACGKGCSHCCRFHILTNSAEGYALAQFIKREFSEDEIRALRLRTKKWHDWDNSLPGRHPWNVYTQQTDFSDYDHSCPLLVNDACSIYRVRPVICRTHFVASHPRLCEAAGDPKKREGTPTVLSSVISATNCYSDAIREQIENEGKDFAESIMLLPHSLAIEMEWDFSINSESQKTVISAG